MSTQRGRGKGQRRPRRSSNSQTNEETLPPQNDNTEIHSKQGYLAFQKAFHDISRKFQLAKEEKLMLQTQNTVLQKENENLKQTLEKGFKAFDDKYKETEKLKKELDSKQNADKMNQGNTNKSTGLDRTCQEIKELPATQEVQKLLSSTQTEDKKSDGVTPTLSNCTHLLEDCGLKIVSQDDKNVLIITNISSFNCWVKNSTNGKVRVDFQTPVTERFVQNDQFVQNIDRSTTDHEAMIILLKNKITDQANVIKAQRQILTKMREKQFALSSKKEIPNKSNQYHILKRYHETFLHYSQEATNQIKLLQIQLENQTKYTKRLLIVVTGSKDLPKQLWWLSELRHVKKCQKESNESSFPVPEQQVEDDAEENLTNEDDYENDYYANGGLYSNVYQETGESPFPTGNESSASVVNLVESRSSSGNSKLGLQTSRVRDSIAPNTNNLSGFRKDLNPNTPTDSNNDNCDVAQTENDDFVVLNEEPLASEGAFGKTVVTKRCPVCYISFTSTYDQEAFEAHVLAHFRD